MSTTITTTVSSGAGSTTLLAIRTKLRELTGRYDLVGSDYSDNGMDFFINAGQKLLDLLVPVHKTKGRKVLAVAANVSKIDCTDLRFIDRVIWYNSDHEPSELQRVLDTVDIELEYAEEDEGTPAVYGVGVAEAAPSTYDSSLDGTDELYSTPSYTKQAIIIRPIPDAAGTISIVGSFKSKELSADGDTSFWTVNYPHLVMYAAAYHLERFYRNQSGANEWMDAIKLELAEIDKDEIEMLANGHNLVLGG